MSTKTIASVAVLLVIIGLAYLASRYAHQAPTITPLEIFASTSADLAIPSTTAADGLVPAQGQPAKSSSGPTLVSGAPVTHVVHITLAFDKSVYTTSDPYPVFGGTGSNVSSAQILVKDSNGVGIEAATIAIKNGRWLYPSSRALTPGNYTVWLGTPDLVVEAKLAVERP